MTAEEAINHFKKYIDNECYTEFHRDACKMAISAIASSFSKEESDCGSSTMPCPFCKLDSLGVLELMTGGYCVFCNTCLTYGPMAETKEKAIEKWNCR